MGPVLHRHAMWGCQNGQVMLRRWGSTIINLLFQNCEVRGPFQKVFHMVPKWSQREAIVIESKAAAITSREAESPSIQKSRE